MPTDWGRYERCRLQHPSPCHHHHVLRVAGGGGLDRGVPAALGALPDISAPFLFVQLPYTGSTPDEVERTWYGRPKKRWRR